MVTNTDHQKSPILIFGPTAIGKTNLAIDLVQKIPAEIISVDSSMVYRGMDIGTGKPTPEELIIAPHHLINIRDPHEAYSAAEFCRDAKKLISEISARNRTPILVGGTMLYFKALLEGLSPLPSSNETIRQQLVQELTSIGVEAMHQKLKKIDPQSFERIHPNDSQRILRALEVYAISGKPMSEFFSKVQHSQQFQCQIFALFPDNRALLHQRIEARFKKMLSMGLIDEIQILYRKYNLTILPALRSVGYRQVWEYLAGQHSYNDMVERAIAATRQLAKRQLTWLRNSFFSQSELEIRGHQFFPLKITDLDEKNHRALLQTVLNCVLS